ncbi:hypothetical protein ACVW1A_003717 [Bradyrhizobium sp. LB1.3]
MQQAADQRRLAVVDMADDDAMRTWGRVVPFGVAGEAGVTIMFIRRSRP